MTTLHEVLRAPTSWWAAVFAFAVACGWIVLVASTLEAGVVVGVVAYVVIGFILWRWGHLRIKVSANGLRAGRAFIEPEYIGQPEILGPKDYRRKLGRGANALAFLITRPWADRGVLVPIVDENDPTPYWIISTNEPQRLAGAINTMRLRARPAEGGLV